MLVPAVLAAALVVGALFAGESFWLGALALLAAGVAGTLALLGRLPLARGGGSVVGALLAIAVWNGISVAWSIAPDRSWGELNRGLVYASFAVVGLVLGSLYGDRSARVVAAILTGAFAVAILWALAGKAIPALFPDGGRAARLRDPIGYWNALALVGDGLLVLGLWLAATRSATVALRAGGAVLAYAAVSRDPAHGLARRRRGRDRRRRAVALAGTVADRAGAARPRDDRARARSRWLGVHAAGARRGRTGVRGPARGRSQSSRCSS